jgi:MFS family permease
VRGLFPIYARDILLVGPTGLGLLYASRAVGSLFAAAAMALFGPVKHSGRWIFLGIGIYGLSTVMFAGSQVFWFSLLMLTLTGAGDTISSILRSTINQLSTPDELRGRMSSINSIFTSSGPQLGQFESGVVAAWLGTQLSALTGGIATLVVLIAVGASFPRVRQFQIPRFSDK